MLSLTFFVMSDQIHDSYCMGSKLSISIHAIFAISPHVVIECESSSQQTLLVCNKISVHFPRDPMSKSFSFELKKEEMEAEKPYCVDVHHIQDSAVSPWTKMKCI